MWSDIDKKIKLDIIITIIATLVSVDFIISSYIWNEYSSQILSILVIILPMIYIVGNLFIRGIMDNELKKTREEYDELLIDANEAIEEMKIELDRFKA